MSLEQLHQTIEKMGFEKFPIPAELGENKFFCYDQAWPGINDASGIILEDGTLWQRAEGFTESEIARLQAYGLRDGTVDFMSMIETIG